MCRCSESGQRLPPGPQGPLGHSTGGAGCRQAARAAQATAPLPGQGLRVLSAWCSPEQMAQGETPASRGQGPCGGLQGVGTCPLHALCGVPTFRPAWSLPPCRVSPSDARSACRSSRRP